MPQRNAKKNQPFRKTKVEIDLRTLRRNFRVLARAAKPAKILALLKSDAYGHSAVAVANALEKSFRPADGLHGIAVATLEEAIELREAGIRGKVVVMSGIQACDLRLFRTLQRYRLHPVVSSMRELRSLLRIARAQKSALCIDLKINSGMNRLGLDLWEIEEAVRILSANPKVHLEGVLSHFSAADRKNAEITKAQLRNFREVMQKIRNAGFSPEFHHFANSSGLQNKLYGEGNVVRVGLSLYGEGSAQNLQPILRWTAQIYQIRNVARGEVVGYGPLSLTKRSSRIAILGVGYADGYPRILSNRSEVLLHGKRCPIVGAVSMDLLAVDITDVPEVNETSIAVLLGKDRNERITAVELAKQAGTIPWEILTGISSRVPRAFRA